MGVSLIKGDRVDLTKGRNLQEALVALGWDANKYDTGYPFDLDVSVFLLGPNGKVPSDQDFVFYNNLQHYSGGVIHSGDERTGSKTGDDEVITVNFAKIPQNIQELVFVITIHEAQARGQSFGQVRNAYVRVVDPRTNEEILRYDLNEKFYRETAVNVCRIYRYNGEWKFEAVGMGYNGGLREFCLEYGVNVA